MPIVEQTIINDGAATRSSLTKIEFRLDQPVLLDSTHGSPITLLNTTTGTIVGTSISNSIVDGKSRLTLGFLPGNSVIDGQVPVAPSTLANGVYQLRLHSDAVSSLAGTPLDGNNDGVAGDDYVFGGYRFDQSHRWFGELTGDGLNNNSDLIVFVPYFGEPPPPYREDMDLDRDGVFDSTDKNGLISSVFAPIPTQLRPAAIVDVQRFSGEVAEPDSQAAFLVSMSSPRASDTVIQYTVGGDAIGGTDYVSLSGTATILAGQTSVSIDVTVLPDSQIEAPETVAITLISIAPGGTTVGLSPTGRSSEITIVEAPTGNQPPDFFPGQSLSQPGPISLGSYLGRIPAYDPDGDSLTYAISTGSSSLASGLISVDPATGDLYLRDLVPLPTGGTTGALSFTATDPLGLQVSGTVNITIPELPETVSDDYRDAGSHRYGITFDLRPASVSADGETLYTTLLKPDGNPLSPGQTLDDVQGGYTYGSYTAGLDGVLKYTPNETLYADRYFSFNDDFALTGISRLERPQQTLVLLAAIGSSGAAVATNPPTSATTYQRLAERKATPRLTNTQPVGIADGLFSYDFGVLTTRPVFAQLNDLLSIDVSQWFIDPDGDKVIVQGAFAGFGSDNIGIDVQSESSKALIDIKGDVFGSSQQFDQATVTLYISDHPFVSTGPELEIPLRDFDDAFPTYDILEGITYLKPTQRPDLNETSSSTPAEIAGNAAWRQRFNEWRVSSTTFASGTDRAQGFTSGNTSVDLTTGNAKVAQTLPLSDAFDELSIPLGGLIYSGDLVDNKSLAKVVIDRPASELNLPVATIRAIDRFDVEVTLADHYVNEASTPVVRTYQFPVATVDRKNGRFELTVPIIDKSTDVRDSGVFGYQISVKPHYTTTSTDPADRPVTLTSSGRVAVVKQTTVKPADFNSADTS
ncbi:Calx-beta domain protein [Rubripirellula tenax]|uniref:Calx-beta domain protein n=1 Tax=Rubripirellula tenax TaxID=2528015 RepID=A0A5C6FBE6_9BACT|nr:Calx-beta domain-containing protein [Rubripirellula tenax]TWU56951.1 Calx-beta domain protein [Rubripirellula tenax]